MSLQDTSSAPADIYSLAFNGLDRNPIRFADHRNRVILVVNTASQCGFTAQYADLQDLAVRLGPRGLSVIGVPTDDFAQERGSETEIATFCQTRFGVTFQLAAKTIVTGEAAHPFYRWAATLRPNDTPRWNFHKYIIDRGGALVAAFPSQVRPSDPRVTTILERHLVQT